MNDDNLNDIPDEPHPAPPSTGRDVTVLGCIAAKAGHPTKGEPIALITVSFLGGCEAPLIVTLPDARRLAGALVHVLAQHEDPLGLELQERFPEEPWPAAAPRGKLSRQSGAGAQGPGTDAGKIGNPQVHQGEQSRLPDSIKPSRRPQMPHIPITEREAWRMILSVRNARDHETFLKFIGAIPEQSPPRRPPRKRRKRGQ